jgi:hypothetical protein
MLDYRNLSARISKRSRKAIRRHNRYWELLWLVIRVELTKDAVMTTGDKMLETGMVWMPYTPMYQTPATHEPISIRDLRVRAKASGINI